jgi:acyl carrier protein
MASITDTLRSQILTMHLPGESPENLTDETPLQTSGILDSLAMLGIVGFIEKTYGIELDVYDTTLEQFDTIRDIAAVVARKRDASVAGGRP